MSVLRKKIIEKKGERVWLARDAKQNIGKKTKIKWYRQLSIICREDNVCGYEGVSEDRFCCAISFFAHVKSRYCALERNESLGRIYEKMKLKGIKYVQPESFQMLSLVDTDYGNCKETRRSVGCSIITVIGCIVEWWMAKHHTVSNSSCEAEYKELAKCAKGVKFVHSILGELNLLTLPGLIS